MKLYHSSLFLIVWLLNVYLITSADAQPVLQASGLDQIQPLVEQAIQDQRMPGCVVVIGRHNAVLYQQAFGQRQLLPEQEQMTVETLFDLASLTKPIATATSIHLLQQRGKLSFDDPVVKYLPEFGVNGKDSITIRQLLTHTSGLLPDNSLKDYLDGAEEAFRKIDELSLRAQPGEKFMYSDVGFIVLGRIVERVSGQKLDEFARQEIFLPLGMLETGFNPPEELHQRVATTEKRNENWMRGEVHDPRAYALGGVAGHAGLFSTPADLIRYAQAMLQAQKTVENTVITPEIVKQMSEPQVVPGGFRTLGWDSKSGYSSNRGEGMSRFAFGHGGFTGTALWIDPEQDLFVIFLSNRVHPDGKGSVNSLAGEIGTIAVKSIQVAQ